MSESGKSEFKWIIIDQASSSVWYCRKCIAIRKKSKSVQQAKIFLRYVDDIVRTVKGDPEKKLRAANLLYPNLQLTIETQTQTGNWHFQIYKLVLTKAGKLNVGSIKTDTGTILNFRSCAPISTREK